MKYFFVLTFCIFFICSCQKESDSDYQKTAQNPEFLHRSVKQLTDVIVHDIFSPPVASRIYAHAAIAAYEALLPNFFEYKTLVGQVNGLKKMAKPEANQEYCYPLASIKAFLSVGKTLTFSEDKMDTFTEKILKEYQNLGIPKEVYDRSLAFGDSVAKSVMARAAKDGYKETRGQKYTLVPKNGMWIPTPPAYMDAIEPYWSKILPFALDSAAQYAPIKPFEYNTDKNSDFYKEIIEVYESSKKTTEEQIEIAKFWDCNPFVMHTTGHISYATKKITPGGHWINIVGTACKKINANFMKSAETYALVSMALADGFISCWDEKYRSQKVRPETLINKLLDPEWKPLLQTPPFPEYTSGHSVISNAAAVTLTQVLGDNFAYSDSTEIEYGLPARNFKSFSHAAEEAAQSRFYGGIHYQSGITNGSLQGVKVGKHLIEKIKTK
ncbi:MAG: phosphatase PAP2 family protein [Bacteroidetes bacterium]|nr:MAG: phosphatase PAP2 family protein [Bacteroidota bacterium]